MHEVSSKAPWGGGGGKRNGKITWSFRGLLEDPSDVGTAHAAREAFSEGKEPAALVPIIRSWEHNTVK